MPKASIQIFTDEEQQNLLDTVAVGVAILDDGESGYGEPKKLYAVNTGDTILVNVNVGLIGEGKRSIQLARDENGAHGIWAQPGESIVAHAGNDVKPTENFIFWARPVFTAEDAEQKTPFQFLFETTSRVS